MSSSSQEQALREMLDRVEIQEVLCRCARAVDRSDWISLRECYHPDATDDHGGYNGGIDGLIAWLEDRFAKADNGMHFLGNCLIEFGGSDLALVETYFVSQRLRPPAVEDGQSVEARDAICRQAWGRYVDRLERRDGEWRIAHRTVVLDASYTFVARDGVRSGPSTWGQRSSGDPLCVRRSEVLGKG